ncbi:MAG: hypothetical protein ACRYF3_11205 [Janthinobacterium lividum]
MRVAGSTPVPYVDPSSRPTRSISPTHIASATDTVSALTDSDKTFMLNAFGVNVSVDRDGSVHSTPTKPISEDESMAGMHVALQLASDRASGRLQGEVTTSYLTDLLARTKDSGTDAYQAVLRSGIDYLLKGSPVKHIDTEA